jgi:chromate transporter
MNDLAAPETPARASPPLSVPSFWSAFRYWFKLGFINFGGPAGQIAMMHRDLVERFRWISEERFLHALNFCLLLPGPEAQQLATYIGWLFHGARGGLVAGVFFVLPSIFILLALSYLYAVAGTHPAIAGILAGLKPVVLAIVVDAAALIGARSLRHAALAAIAAAAFVAILLWNVPFPIIVLAAGVIGAAAGRLWPRVIEVSSRDTAVSAPAAARGREGLPGAPASRWRSLRILGIGVLLWTVPFALVILARGSDSLHARLYGFFTKAAFVTFGGAYAVLAYVIQAAVRSFGWLSPFEAVDGLALAETTPGPLIMVLQFVGFMAGWHHPEGMAPGASALLAALLTTYATFLPSFLFIFLGAPYIERLRGSASLRSALTGITAAVVGVILQLAWVFGLAVFWPDGRAGRFNVFGLVLALAAFVALRRFRLDVLWIVAGGALVGLLWSLARS